MDSKPRVTLPNSMIERCWDFGRRMVKGYEKPSSVGNAMSLQVASHGAEKNAELQGLAKMGECAFCEWAEVDAYKELSWDANVDRGFDVFCWGARIDAKHSAHPAPRWLIWPINKRHLFAGKPFDVLVSVAGKPPTFTLIGWTLKEDFVRRRQIAKGLAGITDGTWIMASDDLWPVRSLEASEFYFREMRA